MKSIAVFSLLLVAVSANPFADPVKNACHELKPSNPRPDYAYSECNLVCSLHHHDVTCSFDIGMLRAGDEDVRSKMQIESRTANHTELTDDYLCVSPTSVTIESLPYSDRKQCVKCDKHEDSKTDSHKTVLKCEHLSNIAYSEDSMFTLEACKQGQPTDKDNLLDGAVWQVPFVQPKHTKLHKVEAEVDVNSKGIHYKIQTSFH